MSRMLLLLLTKEFTKKKFGNAIFSWKNFWLMFRMLRAHEMCLLAFILKRIGTCIKDFLIRTIFDLCLYINDDDCEIYQIAKNKIKTNIGTWKRQLEFVKFKGKI